MFVHVQDEGQNCTAKKNRKRQKIKHEINQAKLADNAFKTTPAFFFEEFKTVRGCTSTAVRVKPRGHSGRNVIRIHSYATKEWILGSKFRAMHAFADDLTTYP